MTLEYFCGFCGIRTDGNTTENEATKGLYYLSCLCCGAMITFTIDRRPTKTDEEVEAAFQNTPLTDSQRGTKKRFTSQRKK